MPDINTTYDNLLVAELTRRLKRAPSPSEVINGDNDSDLVNEILWQLIGQLSALHVQNASNIDSLAAAVTPIATAIGKLSPAVSIPKVAITKNVI